MEKINIVLSLNSNYIKPTIVCMLSIAKNNRNPIDFYILYSQLSTKEIESIKKIICVNNNNLIPIKIDSERFLKYPTLGRSREAYFRLIISDVLPRNLERCLYLDGDILVTGNIDDFYQTNFDNNAMIVCEDLGEILLFHKERHGIFNIPTEYRYFNSGVLLLNLDYLRKNIKTDILLEYINTNSEKLTYIDQDVLNALFFDKVKFSDSSIYNYMEILVNPILINKNLKDVRIIHFIKKPWKYTYYGKNSNIWWDYAKKIYITDYIKFKIINSIYKKLLAIILIIIPIEYLKLIKNI